METKRPGKFPAILAVLTGVFLLLSGLSAGGGYLRVRLFDFFGEHLLIDALSAIGGIALGLVGGGLAIVHGLGSLMGRPSRKFRLPRAYFFYLVFALILAIGNLLLVGTDQGRFTEALVRILFPSVFVLGASVPVLAGLAFAGRRLGWPATWRQISLSFVSGGTLSILATILVSSVLPYIFYLLIEPLAVFTEGVVGSLVGSGSGIIERIFFSPLLFFYLLYIAFQAPFPEEFAKALGPRFFGRRIRNERMAFLIGMSSGAGFAIVENMRYQGLFAAFYGWSWGGITALRGIGAIDHALWTGIIALALFRERDRRRGWLGRVGRAYLFSVGLHTLWNGGYMALLYFIGLDHIAGAGPSFDVYGEWIEVSLVAILAAMAALNWWILTRYLASLQTVKMQEIAPERITKRALAAWAFACVLVIVPVGAAIGRAWPQIRSVLF